MKRGCELCAKPARMYCDSDQARLCWECDERVHCANFLVAKHTRSLLCHVCQSPTPWKASGAKLAPTISVCDACSTTSYNTRPAQSSRRDRIREDEETLSSVGEDNSDYSHEVEDHYSDSDTSEEDDNTAADGDEEDGENQVVPWSPSAMPSSSAPPLTLTTSSCSEQEGSLSTRDAGAEAVPSPLKRFRHNPRLDSDEEDGCCSSQINSKTPTAAAAAAAAAAAEDDESFRAIKLKMTRREEYSSRINM